MPRPPRNTPPGWLIGLRAEIDAIDDLLIELLSKRSEIVAKVGAMKRANPTGKSHIRPGREADMVRRVYAECKKGKFPAEAAIPLWRTIIAASTSIETNLTVSAYAPNHDMTYYWLAREYFGPFTPISTQAAIPRVIGDVMDGKCEVGIIPIPQGEDPDPWWRPLARKLENLPKIFAYLPFAVPDSHSPFPAALAIALVEPEETGDDITYLALEVEDVSTHRLQQEFTKAKMPAKFVQIHPLSPTRRHILAEIEGFVGLNDTRCQNLLSALEGSVVKISLLGSYATPITIAGKHAIHDDPKRPRPHAKPTALRAPKA